MKLTQEEITKLSFSLPIVCDGSPSGVIMGILSSLTNIGSKDETIDFLLEMRKVIDKSIENIDEFYTVKDIIFKMYNK